MSIREKILKRDWRERLDGTTSNAEIEVFHALQQAGLSTGAFMNKSICLFGTIPDIYYPYTNPPIVIYLDGPVHNTRGRQSKDVDIDQRLKRRGFTVLRYPYTPPLTNKLKQQIIEDVQRELQG